MTLDQYIYNNGIRKADAIKVAKSWGVLTHYVIYLGRESEYRNLGIAGGYHSYGRNRHIFIANMQGGVKILPEEEVLQHLEIYQPTGINRFQGNEYERSLAIDRALSRQNEADYHLILNNCEHFASYVQTGTSSSTQSKVGIALGVLALFGIGAALLSGGDDQDEDDEYN